MKSFRWMIWEVWPVAVVAAETQRPAVITAPVHADVPIRWKVGIRLMKNIEELYKEVMENEALKAEFATAYREGNVSEFLKKHDCDATAEEVSEYVNGVKDEALSLDDLDNVAGGGFCDASKKESCTCDVTCGCYFG